MPTEEKLKPVEPEEENAAPNPSGTSTEELPGDGEEKGEEKMIEKSALDIQKEKTDKLHAEVLARCIPIAKQINRIMLEEDVEMGDVKAGSSERYVKAAGRIQELFLEHNLPWFEREYVFQFALQPVSMVQNLVLAALDQSYELFSMYKFGLKDQEELTMRVIHEGLKQAGKEMGERIEKEKKEKESKPEQQ